MTNEMLAALRRYARQWQDLHISEGLTEAEAVAAFNRAHANLGDEFAAKVARLAQPTGRVN